MRKADDFFLTDQVADAMLTIDVSIYLYVASLIVKQIVLYKEKTDLLHDDTRPNHS